MPVSDPGSIAPILYEVIKRQPKTVLDLGVGGGKYGVLCREVLDWVHGRMNRDSWEHTIFGIEGFPKYRNPAYGVYDQVNYFDFREVYHNLNGFDMVLMIDSLEHVERTQADIILAHLVKHNRRVIVSVPIGKCPQDGVFGNELERHLSTWKGSQEFAHFPGARLLHSGVCAVVSIPGECKG